MLAALKRVLYWMMCVVVLTQLKCHVAAAMVAASTSFGYSSVNQFDGNRSIM